MPYALEPEVCVYALRQQLPQIMFITSRPDTYRQGWGRGTPPEEFAVSEEEFKRVARQQVPTRRFHYQQRAAELAWLASTLLPDDDPHTAEILHTAGLWLAARYPEDAQLFYKTLVFRCPNTDLGQAAAARRWFVPPETPNHEKPGA